MKYVYKIFIVFILITFFSCSKIDNEGSSEADFFGHWLLTSAKTDRLVDYNNDNQKHNDLVDDFSCFLLELTINENGRFTETRVDKEIVNSVIFCSSQKTAEGTWRLQGNDLIVFTYSNGSFENESNEYYFLNNKNSVILKRNFVDEEGVFLANLRFSKSTH